MHSLVPLENPILLSKLSESSGIVSLQLNGTKNATTSGLSSSHLGWEKTVMDCANLLIYLNVCLIVTICVILGAILHSVCYTDAVYSNNFERIYGSFSESFNNLEISEQYWTNNTSNHPAPTLSSLLTTLRLRPGRSEHFLMRWSESKSLISPAEVREETVRKNSPHFSAVELE